MNHFPNPVLMFLRKRKVYGVNAVAALDEQEMASVSHVNYLCVKCTRCTGKWDSGFLVKALNKSKECFPARFWIQHKVLISVENAGIEIADGRRPRLFLGQDDNACGKRSRGMRQNGPEESFWVG